MVSALDHRWLAGADSLLRHALPKIRLLSCVTPSNLREELQRLEVCFVNNQPQAPSFRYEANIQPGIAELLERAIEQLPKDTALADLYVQRFRELKLEVALCSAVDKPEFRSIANKRYAGCGMREEADVLAREWLGSPWPPGRGLRRSDDPSDPLSLLSRLREDVGRLRLPFRVVVSEGLSALAATGHEVLLVAAGNLLSDQQTERTVLHEIFGHAVPRTRARTAGIGLFGIGTAGGSDCQEGYALHLEEQAGMLGADRRRELAARHLACHWLTRGADFVEISWLLLAAEVPIRDALRIAARVTRGSGLARERVYLPAFLRVRAALAEDPSVESVLQSGQVALGAVEVLRGIQPSQLAGATVPSVSRVSSTLASP